MQFYRLDATHGTGEGAFVKFYADLAKAELADERFTSCGWLCDVYPQDVSMGQSVSTLLFNGVWPNEDTRTILLQIGSSTITQVKADLDQIIELKQQHLQRRRNAK